MIRAGLSVLPRSSCVSWSRKARNLLRRRFHTLKDEKRSFESRRHSVQHRGYNRSSRGSLLLKRRKNARAFFRLNEYARSSRTFPTEKFSSLSGLNRSGRGFRAPHDQRFDAGSRQGSTTLDPEKNACAFFRLMTESWTRFRAPHDQRFDAGSRQGSATLDPEKNARAFFRFKGEY